MELGFLTACMPEAKLADILDWAAVQGFQALEVSAWPVTDGRPFTASHIAVESLDAQAAADLAGDFAQRGVSISALAYYENNLDQDPAVRKDVHNHLRSVIDAAALLGVTIVGTFIGRDNTKSVVDNLAEGERVLPPLVQYAADRNVRLAVENCPMEGWHPDAYPANLAYSPELWDWLTGIGFWLNYDPSHLIGMGIDPIVALRHSVDKVVHVQAKDVEVLPGVRDRYGFLGRTWEREQPWDHTWWRFRVPGLGQVDWNRVIDVLYEGGFNGVVSIEHEDPVWRGSLDRVKDGLRIAQRTLTPLLIS